MKYAIHKFRLNQVGLTEVVIQKDAPIYKFAEQNGEIVFWARIALDEALPLEQKTFFAYMTGQEIKQMTFAQDYKDTILLEGGAFVVHIFEIAHTVPFHSEGVIR